MICEWNIVTVAVSHGVNLYGFKDAVINCIWFGV